MNSVYLPDMSQVHDWFEANKLEINCKIRTEHMPNTSDVRITVETNSEEIQKVLIMEFCMALRKGEFLEGE